MLDVVVLSLVSFLAICLGLLCFLSLVISCCKICKRTKKPSSRRDVELGLENTQQNGSFPEDGLTSSSTLYRRITEPEIINGKLYGQDYFAIKERLDRTKSLFRDDKVESGLAIQLSKYNIYLFSSLLTSILSATMAR